MVKEIDMQFQEAQGVPNKMDVKRPTPRHIVIKMPMLENLTSSKIKEVIYL